MDDSISVPGDAKEIISSPENWINSQPLALHSLRGKAVLLYFWAYSCAACTGSAPFLKELWSVNGKKDFILIAIHAPDLEFEKNIYNLKMALRRMEVQYPVLHDPEGMNRKNYNVIKLPFYVLIGRDGNVLLESTGESGLDEISGKIAEMLGERDVVSESRRAYPFFMTREIHAGSSGGHEIGSLKICTKESCDEYYDPGNHKEGIIYLKGDWSRETEYLAFWGNSGYISVKFNAKEVNAVMDGSGHAEVLYHGEVIDADDAGSDVIFKRGRSFVSMNGPRIYSLLKLDRYMPGELKLIPFRGFRIYSYTFA